MANKYIPLTRVNKKRVVWSLIILEQYFEKPMPLQCGRTMVESKARERCLSEPCYLRVVHVTVLRSELLRKSQKRKGTGVGHRTISRKTGLIRRMCEPKSKLSTPVNKVWSSIALAIVDLLRAKCRDYRKIRERSPTSTSSSSSIIIRNTKLYVTLD